MQKESRARKKNELPKEWIQELKMVAAAAKNYMARRDAGSFNKLDESLDSLKQVEEKLNI